MFIIPSCWSKSTSRPRPLKPLARPRCQAGGTAYQRPVVPGRTLLPVNRTHTNRAGLDVLRDFYA